MNYRYRLRGINWFPLIGLALATLSLWTYLKYYDTNRVEDLTGLKLKILVQVGGWILLWRFLTRGWFRVRYAFFGFWALAVFNEIGQSVYRHDGFRFVLSVLLGVLFYLAVTWIEASLSRAGINPNLKWYEGKLSTIPHVDAELTLSDQQPIQAGLRTIDENGAFILLNEPLEKIKFRQLRKPVEVLLRYKGEEVLARGKVTATLDWEQKGLGLQFSFEDLYHRDKYGGLVQQLKGEGLT